MEPTRAMSPSPASGLRYQQSRTCCNANLDTVVEWGGAGAILAPRTPRALPWQCVDSFVAMTADEPLEPPLPLSRR